MDFIIVHVLTNFYMPLTMIILTTLLGISWHENFWELFDTNCIIDFSPDTNVWISLVFIKCVPAYIIYHKQINFVSVRMKHVWFMCDYIRRIRDFSKTLTRHTWRKINPLKCSVFRCNSSRELNRTFTSNVMKIVNQLILNNFAAFQASSAQLTGRWQIEKRVYLAEWQWRRAILYN